MFYSILFVTLCRFIASVPVLPVDEPYRYFDIRYCGVRSTVRKLTCVPTAYGYIFYATWLRSGMRLYVLLFGR